MSDPRDDGYDGWRRDARKELAACVTGSAIVMAIVTLGILAWIKFGGPR